MKAAHPKVGDTAPNATFVMKKHTKGADRALQVTYLYEKAPKKARPHTADIAPVPHKSPHPISPPSTPTPLPINNQPLLD